jgi:hypothetical protein
LRRQATLAAAERAGLGWPVSQPFQNRQAASMTLPGETRDAPPSPLYEHPPFGRQKRLAISELGANPIPQIPAHGFHRGRLLRNPIAVCRAFNI